MNDPLPRMGQRKKLLLAAMIVSFVFCGVFAFAVLNIHFGLSQHSLHLFKTMREAASHGAALRIEFERAKIYLFLSALTFILSTWMLIRISEAEKSRARQRSSAG